MSASRAPRRVLWVTSALLLSTGCSRPTTPDLSGGGPQSSPEAATTASPAVPPTPSTPPIRADGTIYAEATMMGTHWSINVFLSDAQDAERAGAAIQEAMTEVARIEGIASEWQQDSELSRLNRSAGHGPQPASPELFEILSIAEEVSEATDGAFDVSFHGVGQLWSFQPGARPPVASEIKAKLALVDHNLIELDASHGTVALLQPGVMIGLGAIAKGYAVDRAAAIMRARGFPNVIVEGGGDVFVSGSKGPQSWQVGVQDPTRRGAVGQVDVTNEAVVTSGNYQRFFEFEGVRYAHILDPRTGRPIPFEDSPRSVTVVAADATRADAYATALAVLGREAGLRLANQLGGVEAIFVEADGSVHTSTALRRRFDRIPVQTPPQQPARPPTPATVGR